jgi:hypothetical protein
MDKLVLMLIAAELTNASVGSHANDELKSVADPDPEIKNPQLRARNLEVWEVFRIYYNGVQKALADDSDWPAPAAGTVSAGNVLSGIISPDKIGAALPAIAALVPQARPILDAVQALLSAPRPAAKPAIPSAPIPNPGEKK